MDALANRRTLASWWQRLLPAHEVRGQIVCLGQQGWWRKHEGEVVELRYQHTGHPAGSWPPPKKQKKTRHPIGNSYPLLTDQRQYKIHSHKQLYRHISVKGFRYLVFNIRLTMCGSTITSNHKNTLLPTKVKLTPVVVNISSHPLCKNCKYRTCGTKNNKSVYIKLFKNMSRQCLVHVTWLIKSRNPLPIYGDIVVYGCVL